MRIEIQFIFFSILLRWGEKKLKKNLIKGQLEKWCNRSSKWQSHTLGHLIITLFEIQLNRINTNYS